MPSHKTNLSLSTQQKKISFVTNIAQNSVLLNSRCGENAGSFFYDEQGQIYPIVTKEKWRILGLRNPWEYNENPKNPGNTMHPIGVPIRLQGLVYGGTHKS